MKNNKKGFVIPLITVTIFLLIGVGFYVYKNIKTIKTPEIPTNVKLTYRTGALHADWGTFSLQAGEGKSVITKYFRGEEKEYTISFSNSELIEIYNLAREQGFFRLNEEYDNPDVMDGGGSWITINYNNKTKSVSVINTEQKNFDIIESKIREKIREKMGKDAFSYKEFQN